MTHKGPVTAKTTAKVAHVSPPSPSRKGATPNAARKKATSSAMSHARTAAQTEAAVQTESKIAEEVGPKKYADMTEEEREREVQRILQFSELMPTVDPFGQEVTETLGAFLGL